VLIPSAGFGTRVGNPNAKEMLLRPENTQMAGQPMITYALNLGKDAGSRMHVVLRAEKVGLLKYLKDLASKDEVFKAQLTTQLVSKTREWPETVLLAQPYWTDYNVVCLPDTDFLPRSIIKEIFLKLEAGADVVFATFTESDYRSWGVISRDGGPASEKFRHCEKPTEWDDTTRAWGLFGFRKNVGAKILTQMLESTFDHNWRPVPGEIELIPITYFADLARGPSA